MSMKKTLSHILSSILITLILSSTTLISGEKTSLQWKNFNDGIAQAKKTNKKILLDVYTDWCGWCKKMDEEVYTNKDIASYLADRYIVVKLDAESESKLNYDDKTMSEMQLAQGFGVTGYPTTIFMKANGDAITLVAGYIPAETFIEVITFIGEDHYKKMKWEEYVSKKKGQ